jgi:hypothetical protein
MVATGELRRLKSELVSFESMNLEDIKFFTAQLNRQIRHIKDTVLIQDAFYRDYADKLILSHLRLIEEYVDSLDASERLRLPFIGKALRYHFNCIIDSYTFAFLTIQHG